MKMIIATFIGFLGVAVAAPSAQAQCCNEGPSKAPECSRPQQEATSTSAGVQAEPMMDGYTALSAALYKDDLKGAKSAAAGMADHDGKSSLAPIARKLSTSNSLGVARQHFQELSNAATGLVKGGKGWHVMNCPMAFGGAGANWLQKSADEVRNPYMGKKMPHCGTRIK